MSDSTRLCFITPGHIASNPRLVKEASAASAAGYQVRVVFSQYMDALLPGDAAILEQHPDWGVHVVPWRTDASGRRLRRRSAVRQRAATAIFRTFALESAAPRALNRIYDEQVSVASLKPADLFIAHNLGALPVALAAAKAWNARASFDAEDFHSGDVDTSRAASGARRLIEWAESIYIPRADAVSAASRGIADAYASRLDIVRPTTILNVFEQADREVDLPERLLDGEQVAGGRSLYWFSQTIGPNRGLETAVDALALLPNDVHLCLRGMWAVGYESQLRGRAAGTGVNHRVHARPSALPSQMVRLAACHDVGLALEVPVNENRRVCVSNKLFTYLLAGVPVAASATDGQAEVARGLSESVRLFPPGDAPALARVIRDLLASSTARAAASHAAVTRYSWDVEQSRFLALVESLVGAPDAQEKVHA